MIRFNRALWLCAAASVVFAMGCGGNDTPDGGSGACTTDATCGSGKACHPILKTCVATCSGSSDCPSSEKTCAKIANSAASFCTCSTNELCAAAVGNNICNSATRQCSAKCTANSCPSGFTCNTTSGDCTAGGTDAGTDAGVACTDLGTCVYPEVCDFTASVCKAGATCNTAAVQPDTCGYAGYCTGAANCAQVEKATCSNFASTGNTPAVFNPKTSTGPIIYYVENDPSPPAASCFKGFFVHSFFLNAYSSTNWPAQLAAIPGGWYVDSTGNKLDITGGLPGSYYVPNGKEMRLRKYLCAKVSTSITAGFYFTGGNETCTASTGAVAGTTSCTSNAQCGTGSTCDMGTGICG